MKTRIFFLVICNVFIVLVGCQKEPLENFVAKETVYQTKKVSDKDSIMSHGFRVGSESIRECYLGSEPFYIGLNGGIGLVKNGDYSGFFPYNLNAADWEVTNKTTSFVMTISNSLVCDFPFNNNHTYKIELFIPSPNLSIYQDINMIFCYRSGEATVDCGESNASACFTEDHGQHAVVILP